MANRTLMDWVDTTLILCHPVSARINDAATKMKSALGQPNYTLRMACS